MTDEAKITCDGLGVIPSDRLRPTPPGWREGPLPAYERCPGCAACPPTAEQLIEARVRAEVAADLRAAFVAGAPLPPWAQPGGVPRAAAIGEWAAKIALGSSPDTTPEPEPWILDDSPEAEAARAEINERARWRYTTPEAPR